MISAGRGRHILAMTALLLSALGNIPLHAADTQVQFDVPDTIECRDVTPKDFAAVHPSLKVIEAKFRVSARFLDGDENDVVDFLYMVTSPGMHLKIQDYLPNTTLESTMADDRIEVTATTEHSDATNEDAHVAYKVLALGGTRNDTSKKTEADHYKQIVPKALVLASGTMNREHGVFFKIRPSKGTSLEGAKGFTFLAIVSKEWRGDWCVISCAARAKKKGFFSTSVEPVGVEQAHVGMYMSGDHEARSCAEELCELQEANESALNQHSDEHDNRLVAAMHAATTADHQVTTWLHSLFGGKVGTDNFDDESPADSAADPKTIDIQKQMLDVQEQLSRLSGI